MKKISALVLISFFVFVSCNNMTKSKRATIKKVNTKEAPIPEFVEIEKFIRPSYKNMDSDEIRRETYIAEANHLDLTSKNLILKGKVKVGMYKEDVFASLGNPQNKIRYSTEFGNKEEWIYASQILHMENGVLKNIEMAKK